MRVSRRTLAHPSLPKWREGPLLLTLLRRQCIIYVCQCQFALPRRRPHSDRYVTGCPDQVRPTLRQRRRPRDARYQRRPHGRHRPRGGLLPHRLRWWEHQVPSHERRVQGRCARWQVQRRGGRSRLQEDPRPKRRHGSGRRLHRWRDQQQGPEGGRRTDRHQADRDPEGREAVIPTAYAHLRARPGSSLRDPGPFHILNAYLRKHCLDAANSCARRLFLNNLEALFIFKEL